MKSADESEASVDVGGTLVEQEVAGVRVWSIEIDAVRMPECLTDAEAEVAQLLLEGKSNLEIATLRATSARTTANQLASIYNKLDVNSRSELASKLAG